MVFPFVLSCLENAFMNEWACQDEEEPNTERSAQSEEDAQTLGRGGGKKADFSWDGLPFFSI